MVQMTDYWGGRTLTAPNSMVSVFLRNTPDPPPFGSPELALSRPLARFVALTFSCVV